MLLEATPELNPPILGMSGEIQPMEALEVILGVECPPRRGLKSLKLEALLGRGARAAASVDDRPTRVLRPGGPWSSLMSCWIELVE